MPYRKTPLVTGEIYHLFSRSVAQQPIFRNKWEYDNFLRLIEFYRFSNPPVRFSHYIRMNKRDREKLLGGLYSDDKPLVDIFALTLMPNHYHLLVKQLINNGISDFIRLIQNSYARYLNTKINRFGSLFQSPFKGVRIETDEQFIHVARYIHLNPLTSHVLNNIGELKTVSWNSFKDCVSKTPRRFINTSKLRAYFKSDKDLLKFTKDNIDYQRRLEEIKHLALDSSV